MHATIFILSISKSIKTKNVTILYLVVIESLLGLQFVSKQIEIYLICLKINFIAIHILIQVETIG